MPKVKRPKRGSMGFYPRKRAKRIYPQIKAKLITKETKPLGFAGYKAGMTHIILMDNNPFSPAKSQEISSPVTVVACPPLSVFGFRCYTGNTTSFDVFSEKLDKKLARKIKLPKQPKKVEEQIGKIPSNTSKINLLCHTNPTFKKKPEIFEVPLGGTLEDQKKYAQEILGKEIKISDVFKEGDLVDVTAVTKGKGTQGEVKRFGVKTLGRKAQKMQRHVGTHGQNKPGKVRYTVPQPGQMGFQTRTELNKRIVKIENNFDVKGGFTGFRKIVGDSILIQGSIPGPKKRLIAMRFGIRPKKVYPLDIKHISKSKQGV